MVQWMVGWLGGWTDRQMVGGMEQGMKGSVGEWTD